MTQNLSSSALKVCVSHLEENTDYSCNESSHRFMPQNTSSHENLESALSLIQKSKSVKALHLAVRNSDDLGPLFSAVAEKFTELEHIEVAFVFGKISDDSMAIILRVLNGRLKHFIINESREKCEMYPPGSQRPQCFGNETIVKLFSKCPNIELLALNTGSGVSGDGLKHIPPNLKSLYLPSTWLKAEEVTNLVSGNGKNVENFELIAAEEEQFKIICENMLHLKSLSLPTLQLKSANPILCLAKLKNLERILIGLSGICIDKELLSVLPNLSSLKRVCFTLCAITDTSLTQFSKLCPELEEIEIYNYNEESRITDLSVSALSDLKNLRTLCIPQANVSEKCVQELHAKHKNLKLQFK